MRRNRHPAAKAIQDAIEQSIERERTARPRRNPGNHEAPLVSPAELRFRALAIENGWEVHRSGWPDFYMTRGGELLLVEVKGDGDRLRKSQVALFAALESHGIQVRVWWARRPERLLKWRDFDRVSAPRATRSGAAARGDRFR